MKDKLQAIHFWIAITLAIPIALIGLTGSAIVFQPELDQDHDPVPYYRPAIGKPHSVDQIVVAAEKAMPRGYRPTAYVVPRGHDDTAMVEFVQPPGVPAGAYAVFVDPVSLHIAGTLNRRPTFLDHVHDLHSSLLAGNIGTFFVGWMGVAMFFLGVTGLIIRLIWARGVFRALVVKKGARGFAFFREWHGFAGIVGFLFFTAVALTGIDMAFPSVDAALVSVVAPQDFAPPHAPQFSPTLHVPILHWARKPKTAGEKFLGSLGAVHSGEIGGYPLRAIVFLIGLLPTFLIYTGLRMWWIKRKARLRSRIIPATSSA